MLMLPALLACLIVSRWWPVLRHTWKLYAAVLVYLLYMAGSAYLQNYRDGFEYLVWSFYIAVFLLAIGYCMEISQYRFAELLFAAAMVAALAAAYAIARDGAHGAIGLPTYRLIGYGPLYNPLRSGHLFGAFLIIAAWCALLAPISAKSRALAALAALIIFAATVLTGSRAPLVALAVVAMLMTQGVASTRLRWRYMTLIGAVTALLLMLFWTRLLDRGLSLRPEMWRLALNAAVQNPWLGVGLGGQFVATASNGVTYYDTHNIFLAALYYGGIFGLLLFLGLFGAAFQTAWRERNRSRLCALAAPLQIYGIVTLQVDGGSLIGRPNEFWVLYWLPIAITLYAQRQPFIEGKKPVMVPNI